MEKRYKLGQKLGSGSFGAAYLVYDRQESQCRYNDLRLTTANIGMRDGSKQTD